MGSLCTTRGPARFDTQTLKNEKNERRQKHLWVLHAACAKILARWFTEKTEVSNEQAESVEHVKVRSTKSKTGKQRLLNTEPLPGGGGGWAREESSRGGGEGGGV